jgi:hypothetical protein
VHLREKTLWRMRYETAGRAEESLGVNIEDLDIAGRRCARSRRRARGPEPAAGARLARTTCWSPCTGMPVPLGRCPVC